MSNLLLIIYIFIPGVINFTVAYLRLLEEIRYGVKDLNLYKSCNFWRFSIIEFGLPCILFWGIDSYLIKTPMFGQKIFASFLLAMLIIFLFHWPLNSPQKIEVKELNLAILAAMIPLVLLDNIYKLHEASWKWLCNDLRQQERQIKQDFWYRVRRELEVSPCLNQGLSYYSIYISNVNNDLSEDKFEKLRSKVNSCREEKNVDKKIEGILDLL